VIVIGGPDEAELGVRVLNAIANPKSAWSLIGRVGLGDLPALIARCALFVGNNSGPQHIAAGLGVPTVGIHSGVVDAREWGPKGTHAVAIQRAMACGPCYLTKPEDCSRRVACLRGLLPADVARICRRLLGTAAAGQAAANRVALPGK
jgi:ADP-heptose:LPS heptosyltransferase